MVECSHKQYKVGTTKGNTSFMKSNRITSLIQAVFVLAGAFVLATPTVLAVTDAASNTPSSSPTTAATAKLPEKLADRIAQYKTKQAITLGSAEATKLKGACKAAQAKAKSLALKAAYSTVAREKVYSDITSQLKTITARIKDADIDTKDLQEVSVELAKRIAQYKTDYASYGTSVADISEVDCVTDPTAFKVALLTARTNRATVVADTTAIREYIPTITAKLAVAKEALASTKDATAQPQTDGGTE